MTSKIKTLWDISGKKTWTQNKGELQSIDEKSITPSFHSHFFKQTQKKGKKGEMVGEQESTLFRQAIEIDWPATFAGTDSISAVDGRTADPPGT